MTYIIRRAEVDEAKVLANIQTVACLSAYEGLVSLEELKKLEKSHHATWQKILQEDGSDIIAIAEIDGVCAGFLAMDKRWDPDARSNIMEVYAFYFLPEFWGMGKAKSLLKFALDYARKRFYKGMSIWILKENKRARRFYEKNDFFYDARDKVVTIGGVELSEMRYWNTLIGQEAKWWRLL